MAKLPSVENMAEALQLLLFPTVTVWNRLEGRPRTADFSQALRAEVRDPLWMLSRQWQLGEFRGDDTGSPVTARYRLSTTQLTRFQPNGGDPVDLDPTVPLETLVERRAPAFSRGDVPIGIDLRLAMGRQWLRSVRPALRDDFVDRYGFDQPDPLDADDVELTAHPSVVATLQAIAGRAMDGYALYEHLTAAPGNLSYDGMVVPAADRPDLDDAAERFVRWFDTLITRPPETTSWDSQRFEHRCRTSAPVDDAEKVFIAEEFPGGHLDWHSFSVVGNTGDDSNLGAAGNTTVQASPEARVLPANVAYDGMPNPRWWTFEDGRTNFGDVRADTTDLARLLYLEFALVYGNDWYLIPCDLPVGTVARIDELVVTNDFGETQTIGAAGAGSDQDWRRWNMFTLDIAGRADVAADTSLLLLPSVPTAQQGADLEDVLMLRDEMANMVWGVERTVTLPTGAPQRGAEVAGEALEHRIAVAGPPSAPAVPPTASIAYRVMTTVPEHWIPFVPVHVPGQSRSIQLQRGAMPRTIPGAPVERVRPRTSLLREGLDTTARRGFFVYEEEVPRAGAHIQVHFRRARWRDGRVVVWLAAQKRTGRGEGSSGLAFDRITPAEGT